MNRNIPRRQTEVCSQLLMLEKLMQKICGKANWTVAIEEPVRPSHLCSFMPVRHKSACNASLKLWTDGLVSWLQ